MPVPSNTRHQPSSAVQTRSASSTRAHKDSVGEEDKTDNAAVPPRTASKINGKTVSSTSKTGEAKGAPTRSRSVRKHSIETVTSTLNLALASVNQRAAALNTHGNVLPSLATSWRHLRRVFDAGHVASHTQSQATDARERQLARAWRVAAFHSWALARVDHCEAIFSAVSKMPGMTTENNNNTTDTPTIEHQDGIGGEHNPDQEAHNSKPVNLSGSESVNDSNDGSNNHNTMDSDSPRTDRTAGDASMPRRLRALARAWDSEVSILEMVLGMHGITSSRHAILSLTRLVKQRTNNNSPFISLATFLTALDAEHTRVARLGKASLRQITPQTILRHVISNVGGKETVYRGSRALRPGPANPRPFPSKSYDSDLLSQATATDSQEIEVYIGDDQQTLGGVLYGEDDVILVQHDEPQDEDIGEPFPQDDSKRQKEGNKEQQKARAKAGRKIAVAQAGTPGSNADSICMLVNAPIRSPSSEPPCFDAELGLDPAEIWGDTANDKNQKIPGIPFTRSPKRPKLSPLQSFSNKSIHGIRFQGRDEEMVSVPCAVEDEEQSGLSLQSLSTSSSRQLRLEPSLEDLCNNLWRLQPGQWLNDTIVNALMSRFRSPSVAVVHSLTLERFIQDDPNFSESTTLQGSRSTYLGMPLENADSDDLLPDSVCIVLIPAFDRQRRHWVLYSFSCKTAKLELYDPLVATDGQTLHKPLTRRVEQFVQWMFKLPGPVPTSQAETPQQANSDDCGIYIVEFARLLATTAIPVRSPGSNCDGALSRPPQTPALQWEPGIEHRLRLVLLNSAFSGAMALNFPRFPQSRAASYDAENRDVIILRDWVSRRQWYDNLITPSNAQFPGTFVALRVTLNLLRLRQTEAASVAAGLVDVCASRLHARHRDAIRTAVQLDNNARKLKDAEATQRSLLVQFIQIRNDLRNAGLLPAREPQSRSPLPVGLGAVESTAATVLQLLPDYTQSHYANRVLSTYACETQSAWALCVAYVVILYKMDAKERPIRQQAIRFLQQD